MDATYAPLPPSTSISSSVPNNDRLAAFVAHLGTVFGWFLVPLVVYLLERGRSRYAAFHAMQALLWSLSGTVVSAATCGVAIPIFLAFHVYAALKILRGEEYEYPVVGEIARTLVA